ncbi:unnamed protein product [Paramecium sonneborni]|uniref:Transmembrane protein n=1 Tax=Paramecium sonneborni TaxID=65129 RepID=A0A8S1RQZ8_9CILI|nr:unnamed protein product [Paramecium sonneborni]
MFPLIILQYKRFFPFTINNLMLKVCKLILFYFISFYKNNKISREQLSKFSQILLFLQRFKHQITEQTRIFQVLFKKICNEWIKHQTIKSDQLFSLL